MLGGSQGLEDLGDYGLLVLLGIGGITGELLVSAIADGEGFADFGVVDLEGLLEGNGITGDLRCSLTDVPPKSYSGATGFKEIWADMDVLYDQIRVLKLAIAGKCYSI